MRLRIPSLAEIAELRSGSVLVSPLYPLVAAHADRVKALAEKGVTALAVDMIPRTTVAQMMDVLSSQATVAGYYAVILAATHLPRFFPMLMTAAGTIAPARCLILGAGVAGLSAIGTARRLGAVVEAFDVRKVVKEQVESLGAKFVVVETPAGEETQTAGGYAKEASEAYKKNQAEALARHVKSADVVICTALIPGQRAPLLVTAEMVATMKPGSVIVDLAAEQENSCALSPSPAAPSRKTACTIIGELNLPARHGHARQPDVLAQHGEAAAAPGAQRRRPQPQLERRNHRRLRHHPRRRHRAPQGQRAFGARVPDGDGENLMSSELVFGLYIFVLATFVGYQVISRVPPLLHTPLMSGTNAISGISLVGSLVAAGANHDLLSRTLGIVAVAAASVNVVGGFMITDRMLRMFKKRTPGLRGLESTKPEPANEPRAGAWPISSRRCCSFCVCVG